MVESLSNRLKRDINRRVNYKMAMLRRHGMEKDALWGWDTVKNVGEKVWGGVKNLMPKGVTGKKMLDNVLGYKTDWNQNLGIGENLWNNVKGFSYGTVNKPTKALTGVSAEDWWKGITGKGETKIKRFVRDDKGKRIISDPTAKGRKRFKTEDITLSGDDLMNRNIDKMTNRAVNYTNKRWRIMDPKKTHGMQANAMSSLGDAITDKAIDSAASNGMMGALGGAAVGGIGGAMASDDKDRFRNGMMGALAGAGLGGVAGAGLGGLNTLRRGNALKRYVRQGGLQFNGNGDVISLSFPGQLVQMAMPGKTFNKLPGFMQRMLYTNHGNVDQFADSMMSHI